MRDPRLQKLASVLVNYSTRVKKGDLVQISGFLTSEPLVLELFRATLEAGGNPVIQLAPQECNEIKIRGGSEEQLLFENPIELHAIKTADVIISIWANNNTKDLSGVDPKKQATANQARKKFLNLFLQRMAKGEMRWVGTQFPCNASAQEAEMSLDEYEDFVFEAGLLHKEDPAAEWRKISERQQNLVNYLNGSRELRFVAPNGTDLKVGTEGRKWLNCDGRENFPDGEVCCSPLENVTEGVVAFNFPAVYGGREVENVRLQFKEGRVVDASASKNEQYLIAMLDQDEGARILGEIAFGTNYSITGFTKNTLFDEKIGGTFHAAVGAALPECGGTNKSALHWDMVCDLRNGGKVFADGKLISENGRFIDSTWPTP